MNVGIALFNREGHVWLGRRDGTPPPWNWQLPQGGMDTGEAAEAAALRELEEETGIQPDRVEPLGNIPEWLAYDYPPDVREDPRFHKKRHAEVEFDAWRWGELAEIPELIIPWKRDVYVQVVAAFREFSR